MAKAKRKPIAIVTADTHLQDRAWASRLSLRGDAYFSFEQIVAMAIDEGLPIIAAGDLIDKQINEQEPIEFIRQQMDKLQEDKIAFRFVQGQHERQPRPWFMVHPWPEWLQPFLPLTMGGHRVEGFDWHPMNELPGLLSSVREDTEILIMHQVSELSPSPVPELVFGMIPSQIKLLIVGDYHVAVEHVAVNAGGHEMVVLSPGSTCMQAIDEDPAKCVYRLYDDLSWDIVELKTRIVMRAPLILTSEALDAFVTEVGERNQKAWNDAISQSYPEDLRKPILIVPYNPDIPDVWKRIERAVDGKAHLFGDETVLVTRELEEKKEARKKVAEGGLVGCLSLVCDEKMEPKVFAYVRSLLEAENPATVIRDARKEYELDVRRTLDP